MTNNSKQKTDEDKMEDNTENDKSLTPNTNKN
jgi:hypothetical protein